VKPPPTGRVSKITGKPEPKPKNQEPGNQRPVLVPVLKSQKPGTPVFGTQFLPGYQEPVKLYIYLSIYFMFSLGT
jgi:hypothetical protein